MMTSYIQQGYEIPLIVGLTAGATLTIRIIYDWLKNGRGKNGLKKCSEHNVCIGRINDNENGIKEINIDMAKLKTLVDERTSRIYSELQRGTKQFESHGKIIHAIEEKVTKLLTLRIQDSGKT